MRCAFENHARAGLTDVTGMRRAKPRCALARIRAVARGSESEAEARANLGKSIFHI